MRKTLAYLSFGLLVLASACGKKEDPMAAEAATPCRLSILTWSEYIDPQIVEDFKTNNKCEVTIETYRNNEELLARLQGGDTAKFDIVVPSNYIVPTMIQQKLLAELRRNNIPNLANLEDRFIRPGYDPENTYTAAYQWGTIGIYARKSKVGKVDETWGLILDKSKQKGSFVLLESIRELMGSALKYKGHEVNSQNADEIREAGALLADAKSRSLGFENGVGARTKVLDRTADMAVIYNGDAVRGMKDDKDTFYFVPREGGILWVDNLAIPAKAPHRYWAEKFINTILDPKVGAQLSNFMHYATPNKESLPFIHPEDLANPAIYPPAEIMGNLQFVYDVGETQKLYDEAWAAVKAK